LFWEVVKVYVEVEVWGFGDRVEVWSGDGECGDVPREDVTSPKRRYAYGQNDNGYRLQPHRDMLESNISGRININKVQTREPAEGGLP
jgi:hypothetical protein